MKEIVPTPPAIVHNEQQAVLGLFQKYVVPSYGRFELVLARGQGSHLWDVNGKRYLDLGGGIAVCSLGHANAEITDALIEQSRRMVHISNLYYHEPQGRLAQQIVRHLAPGKVFFSNSGAEANEGLYKVARKFGHDEGRFEIITAWNSFHGRTLAGIAATGQEKVKKGFEPAVSGFKHVPYNDLQAVRDAISPATAAILIEGVQGEGGIAPASADYLLGLRQLCDERRMLLLMDEVQCGHFRTGRFQSFQRLLEGIPGADKFLPDGVSMAKSLGGGFPIGAFWVREEHHGVKLCDLLGPGTHATTYGGTPLGCAVANKVFEVIERDRLADNARETGAWMKAELEKLAAQFPQVIKSVRGLGFMLGIELAENIPAFANTGKVASLNFVNRLHDAGVLTVPSGTHVIRFLPALNLTRAEAAEGVALIAGVVKAIA
ncbi:MAG: acetylornithine/N-succinyldiaminopimelate aminotransferase [Limisphaerales bacterium]|nr:MAG: acetylornithine/N-succinyldiaminopimelate aminotransferase [Limisphaerales bacterium]TXT50045.1 MAG: acetylornithine/N-succinyldiaminopimelate aminotransferase [Limisphaerales bacterium]